MGLIICNGMNRAGSTLQYNLVRNLVEFSKCGNGESFFEKNELRKFEKEILDWTNAPLWRVIKTHSIPTDIYNWENIGILKICYIYRDVRDVAASLKLIWGLDTNLIIESLDSAIDEYYNLKKSLHPVLWQKYESVISDMPSAIREVAEFIDINLNEDVLNKTLTACSLDTAIKISKKLALFSRFKNLEIIKKGSRLFKLSKNQGVENSKNRSVLAKRNLDQATQIHANHISPYKGQSGTWNLVLNPDEIAFYTKRYVSWLSETGYLN